MFIYKRPLIEPGERYRAWLSLICEDSGNMHTPYYIIKCPEKEKLVCSPRVR